MSDRTHRLKITWRVLLLGLLLSVQANVVAHEADHLDHGDSSVCAVCSIGSALDGPAANTSVVPAPEAPPVVVPQQPATSVIAASAAPRAARAPPHHS